MRIIITVLLLFSITVCLAQKTAEHKRLMNIDGWEETYENEFQSMPEDIRQIAYSQEEIRFILFIHYMYDLGANRTKAKNYIPILEFKEIEKSLDKKPDCRNLKNIISQPYSFHLFLYRDYCNQGNCDKKYKKRIDKYFECAGILEDGTNTNGFLNSEWTNIYDLFVKYKEVLNGDRDLKYFLNDYDIRDIVKNNTALPSPNTTTYFSNIFDYYSHKEDLIKEDLIKLDMRQSREQNSELNSLASNSYHAYLDENAKFLREQYDRAVFIDLLIDLEFRYHFKNAFKTNAYMPFEMLKNTLKHKHYPYMIYNLLTIRDFNLKQTPVMLAVYYYIATKEANDPNTPYSLKAHQTIRLIEKLIENKEKDEKQKFNHKIEKATKNNTFFTIEDVITKPELLLRNLNKYNPTFFSKLLTNHYDCKKVERETLRWYHTQLEVEQEKLDQNKPKYEGNPFTNIKEPQKKEISKSEKAYKSHLNQVKKCKEAIDKERANIDTVSLVNLKLKYPLEVYAFIKNVTKQRQIILDVWITPDREQELRLPSDNYYNKLITTNSIEDDIVKIYPYDIKHHIRVKLYPDINLGELLCEKARYGYGPKTEKIVLKTIPNFEITIFNISNGAIYYTHNKPDFFNIENLEKLIRESIEAYNVGEIISLKITDIKTIKPPTVKGKYYEPKSRINLGKFK